MRIRKSLLNRIYYHLNPETKSGSDSSGSKKSLCYVLLKEHSFIISFISTGIILFIILSNLPVHYETKDDFSIITILSGKGGFPASPVVKHLNPILNYALYILYKVSPSFPWFGVFLYIIYYMSWTLILSVILRSSNRFSLLLSIPLLFYFIFYHSSFISYTSASLLLSFGVYLCTVEYFIKDEAPIKNIRNYFIFLAVCFYLSFLLRWELILYSLFLILPMIVFMKFEQVKKVFPVLTMLVLVICLNIGFNYFVYLSHQTYYDFDKLRIEFHDTHSGDFHDRITPYAIQKAGWTFEDYMAFRGLWYMHDNHVFNTMNLRTFLEANNPPKDSKYYLENIVSQIKKSYTQTKNISVLLLVSFLSIFIYRSTYLLRLDKVDWLKITVSLGTVIISILFFMYYRFKPRVFGPLYVYLFSMAFLLFSVIKNKEHKIIQNDFQRYFFIIVAGFFMTWALLIVRQEVTTNVHYLDQSEHNKIIINQAFNRIKDAYPASHPIVIQMSATFPYCLRTDFIHPLREYRDFPHIRIFPTGWSINSPYYDMALKNLHLGDGHDFLRWLVDRKDVLLMLNVFNINQKYQMNKILFLWKSYYLRHIYPGMKLDIIPVYDFRNKEGIGLILFQIRSEHA